MLADHAREADRRAENRGERRGGDGAGAFGGAGPEPAPGAIERRREATLLHGFQQVVDGAGVERGRAPSAIRGDA